MEWCTSPPTGRWLYCVNGKCRRKLLAWTVWIIRNVSHVFVTKIYLSIFRLQHSGCNLAFMSASDHNFFANTIFSASYVVVSGWSPSIWWVSLDQFIFALCLSLFHHFRRTHEIIINRKKWMCSMQCSSSIRLFNISRKIKHTRYMSCKTLFYIFFSSNFCSQITIFHIVFELTVFTHTEFSPLFFYPLLFGVLSIDFPFFHWNIVFLADLYAKAKKSIDTNPHINSNAIVFSIIMNVLAIAAYIEMLKCRNCSSIAKRIDVINNNGKFIWNFVVVVVFVFRVAV